MKIFKKYIAAMLIFALALSLCSCSLIDRLKPAPAPETGAEITETVAFPAISTGD